MHLNVPDQVICLTTVGAQAENIPPTIRCHCGGVAKLAVCKKIIQEMYDTVWDCVYYCDKGRRRTWDPRCHRWERRHTNQVSYSTGW